LPEIITGQNFADSLILREIYKIMSQFAGNFKFFDSRAARDSRRAPAPDFEPAGIDPASGRPGFSPAGPFSGSSALGPEAVRT
jgi:hypothetical protein